MREEINELKKNSTLNIVDKPRDKKSVGCKWIFIMKHMVSGSIDTYKVRLVANRYIQTYKIDYEETFSLVA